MSVQGCIEYIAERRDLQRVPRNERKSRQLELDSKLEDFRLKREIEGDDYVLKGVDLTERKAERPEASRYGKENKQNVNKDILFVEKTKGA